MSKKCAYCDQPGKLTRERVWSDCFWEREGREAAHFSVATQSVHGADYVVKNVCQQCNSTLLAPLDVSDNDKYEPQPLDDAARIMGRVVWWAHTELG